MTSSDDRTPWTPSETAQLHTPSRIAHLTPTISVGTIGPPYEHVWTDDPAEAAQVVDNNGSAHLPILELGIQALRLIGLSEARIEDRVYFALPCRLLGPG